MKLPSATALPMPPLRSADGAIAQVGSMPEAKWLVMCAARLRELDAQVAPADASDVAAFMWQQERWRLMEPRAAADAVFDVSDRPVRMTAANATPAAAA